MKNIIKELVISIIISLVLLFGLALLISLTDFDESYINISTIAITSFALFIMGLRYTLISKKNGLLNGFLLAFLYFIILYLLSCIISKSFEVSSNSIFMIFFGVIFGACGGIIGVNLKK